LQVESHLKLRFFQLQIKLKLRLFPHASRVVSVASRVAPKIYQICLVAPKIYQICLVASLLATESFLVVGRAATEFL
jgi:hypothetical protein